METLQLSFLEVPLKKLIELYKNDVVPQLTKKNKVIAIGTAILLVVSYKINTIIRPPRNLRHIPHQSYFSFISSILSKETILERSQRYGLPHINSEESNGIYLSQLFIEDWTIWLGEKFPKLAQNKLYKNSLHYKFVGRPNIVMLSGDHWRDQRKIANPAFNRSMPVEMFGKLTQQLFSEMENMGPRVDFLDLMERWTLEAIGKAGFDFQFNAITDKNNEWVNTYNTISHGVVDPLFFIFPALEAYFLFMFPKRKQIHDELKKFQGMIRGIIEEKRRKIKSGENRNAVLQENEKDLLTLMLESEMKGEGKMTDDELEANICVFFLAGHDTTASALASAICFLAQNPDIQQRAREEAISILGDKPEDILPTIEDTKKMIYINQIMKETLRICGPASTIISRGAVEDCELAGTFIPKGTRLAVNLFETMHSEKNWTDPLKFDPDRFAPDNQKTDAVGKGMNYVPFGNGARQCIGMNFSLNEQRVMLSMLLRKFTWTLPDDSIHKDGLKATGQNVIGPKNLYVEFIRIY
ncbi:cytochrome P450 [Backusella circina FSU 941]|nr:cytochrome P450 [Backusella circina FSU 941]